MTKEYEIRAVLHYTNEHTWARVMADGTVRVGITDYGQKQLKEIVFVELPKVGHKVRQMEPFGSVESVKAASDVCSPVTGEVREINKQLIDNPSLINRDPYGAGWMILIAPSNLEEDIKRLLLAEDYRKLIDP